MSEITTAAQPLREDIIESAIRFLTDPKVQNSTLAKKVSFLETKGLTTPEIEEALARSKNQPLATTTQESGTEQPASNSQQQQALQPSGGNATVVSSAPSYGYAQQMVAPPPPPRPRLDWKDYFIAAVVAGGLGYGIYVLAKKYIGPLLAARDDKERLEEEKKLLLEQNDLTRKQLDTLNDSTTKVLEAMATQSEKTNEAIEGMSALLEKLSTQESDLDTSVRRLHISMDDLQREVSSVSSKNNSKDVSTIGDVQSEIRSLKSLLLSRRAPAHNAPPAMRNISSTASSTPTARSTTPSPKLTGTESAVPAVDSGADAPAPTTASAEQTSEPVTSTDSAESMEDTPSAAAPTPTIPSWQLGGSATNNASQEKGKQSE